MLELMKKFQAMQAREPTKFEVFFSTHPATSDRIDKIEGIIKKNYPNIKPLAGVAIVPVDATGGGLMKTGGLNLKALWAKPAFKYSVIGGASLAAAGGLYWIYRWRQGIKKKNLEEARKLHDKYKHLRKNPIIGQSEEESIVRTDLTSDPEFRAYLSCIH